MPELGRLARRAIAGDSSAVEELLGELRPEIVRTARLIVGAGSPVAEDAAQEALLDVMRGLARLREPDAVRGWAIQVATRRAMKIARRERLLLRRRAAEREYAAVDASPDPRTAALKRAFDKLPPGMRAAAVLRLYTGLSEQETAAVLGCSIGTVKSQLHDARARLAAGLRAEGLAPLVVRTAADPLS